MADLVCNYKRNIGIAFGLLFGFILLFCFYVIIVLAIAFPWTPEKLIRREQPRSADAVVVLDGEYYIRIEHAFKLLEAGFSDTLFTPGLRLTKNKQYIQKLLAETAMAARYYEGTAGNSTYEDAQQTAVFIRERRPDIKSILLVTSTYHSYRAWWIFHRVLKGIEVVSVPIPAEKDWFSIKKIAKGNVQEKVFRGEQLKFLAYYFLYGWI